MPDEHADVSRDPVTVRRAPRYPRFLALGGAVGALIALILTFAFPAVAEYDRGQVFGFLLLILGSLGVALGALLALVLDRVMAGHAATVVAEHEQVHQMTDSIERAVLEAELAEAEQDDVDGATR